LKVWYYKKIAQMDADNVDSSLDTEAERYMVDHAIAVCKRTVQQFDVANDYDARFENGVERLRRRILRQTKSRPSGFTWERRV
jgi:hypothetical protein